MNAVNGNGTNCNNNSSGFNQATSLPHSTNNVAIG